MPREKQRARPSARLMSHIRAANVKKITLQAATLGKLKIKSRIRFANPGKFCQIQKQARQDALKDRHTFDRKFES